MTALAAARVCALLGWGVALVTSLRADMAPTAAVSAVNVGFWLLVLAASAAAKDRSR